MLKASANKNHDPFSREYHVRIPIESRSCRGRIAFVREVSELLYPTDALWSCSLPVMRYRVMTLQRCHYIFMQAYSSLVASFGSSPCIFLTTARKSS